MKRKSILVILLVCLAFAGWVAARAQSGDGYDLTWNTVDGGGGVNRGGAYTLGGAIGQPDAGLLNGGNYTLSGGFWQGSMIVDSTCRIYLPLVLRQVP